MKRMHMVTIWSFAYLIFCAAPAYSAHPSTSKFFSYPRNTSQTVASIIPAFCVGSVLGTFWSYTDAVIPFSLKYVTTYPFAMMTRIAFVVSISTLLKNMGIEHSGATFLGAAWLWEWVMYEKLKG
ncbi:hypothetical protein Noda2021_06510 [Candidatus Dependentiae bacterium Noda2021]|nr:hypothetical protein Noda2021_06510 [Candidatus Dependentiae bacterium Noda2021]